jgi:DUF1009 family protein
MRLGLIAGGGQLPVRLAQFAAAEGALRFIIRLKGMADPLLAAYASEEVGIGKIGGQVDLLRRAGVEQVCLVGYVRRPDFANVELDWKGVRALPRILQAARAGDDALLRVLVGLLEEEGFQVVGADDVLHRLLAPEGMIGGRSPMPNELADLAKAAHAARVIGALDAGQAAVVADGLILALEAQEGTDLMLERVARLPEVLRGTPQRRKGVLVKCPKPQQERRIDLPVIGVTTVERASVAGLAGIGVTAGAALIIDREEVAAVARQLGMFVIGLPEVTVPLVASTP